MNEATAVEKANEIISLFKKFGNNDYIGENVSQIEHMTQCAILAESEGHTEEVILGALLHDIGHLCEHLYQVERMEHFGVVDHEEIGKKYLQQLGFSEKVTQMVVSHVNAKRYLTYKYPEYYEKLSVASKSTLEFQGGKMSEAEATEFEKNPDFNLYVSIRRWDDLAKQEEKEIPALEKYKQMIVAHLLSQ
ncbi:MAG: HDIG domain-containing metalloprotein [Chitinophagia bacterium]|jgi:phosphonate degradation associated HDIG domain protein